MPEQTATPIPTQLNIAPRGKSWKDWRLVDGTDGFPTRETMEKYLCNPARVRELEECRALNLETIERLNKLLDASKCQDCAVQQGTHVPMGTVVKQIQEPQKFTGDSEMRRAFEIEYGQDWTDTDWRKEVGAWASAWHKATAAARELAAAQQGVQPVTGPCGQCKDSRTPCVCSLQTMLQERGLTAVDEAHYLKISQQAKTNANPTQQGLQDAGYAAYINGKGLIRFDGWLPPEDAYDSGTLVKLFALPVSEEEAQAERDALDAAQAKQGEQENG